MSEPKFTKGPWTSSLMNQHSEYSPIILISGGCACNQYCIGYEGDSIVKCEDCIILKALRKARGEGVGANL